MSNSDADIDDLVVKDVRELLSKQKNGERLNVTAKTRELRVHKNRLYRRIKNIRPRTVRKFINYKLLVIQEISFLRYILSLDKIRYSIRYHYINNIINIILIKNYNVIYKRPVYTSVPSI